jgi:hypothetical protein
MSGSERIDHPHPGAGRPARATFHAAWVPWGLVVLVGVCFLPALGAEFVVWDDDLNLTDNPRYRGLSPAHLRWMLGTTLGGHYQPLTWLTFALDHRVWGMAALGYHLTNVALHAANAVLVYLLARVLLARAGVADAASRALGAAVGALVFAVHPLRVESVAWVSERRDVLSGFWYLLALLAYVRMTAADTGARRWRLASFGCFVLSLLAKAWGMTFPVVLLILDVYPLARVRRHGWRRMLTEKALYAVPAAAAVAMAWRAQSSVEEMRSLVEHGLGARLAQAAYGLCFYLWKTLVPTGLSPLYLLDPGMRPTEPRYLVAIGLVVAATMAAIASRRRWPWLLAAWSLYVVVVSPVLGLAQTGPQLVADRYTYLACLPWAVLVAAAAARCAERGGARRVLAVAALVVAILGVSTFHQARLWHDSLRLWNHVLRLDPRSYVAYTNRAFVRGDPAAAIADYTEAIRLNPRYHPAYFNRGELRHARGDVAGAVADYTTVIGLRPGDARAYNNRGWARQALGDWEGAVADYAHALELAGPAWEHRTLVEGNLRRARRHLASRARAPRAGGAVHGDDHDVDGTRLHHAPERQGGRALGASR